MCIRDSVGTESGTIYQCGVVVADAAHTYQGDGFADNFAIEGEADSIIDFTETNPFGMP